MTALAIGKRAQAPQPVCPFLRLPVELRLLIYEELLNHDGHTSTSLWPQILTTCKQIHGEAQQVLDNNSKLIGLIRLEATYDDNIIRFGSSPESATIRTFRRQEWPLQLDAAFEAIRPHLVNHSFLLLYIDLSAFAEESWQLMNQHLYALVTAATLSKIVRVIEVRLKTPSTQNDKSPDYASLLWPLTRVGPTITPHIQGCPAHAMLDFDEEAAEHQDHCTALALWMEVRDEVDELVRIVEEAGIEGTGVKFLPRTFPRMPAIAGNKVVQTETNGFIGVRAERAASIIDQPKWRGLKLKAMDVLRERSVVG